MHKQSTHRSAYAVVTSAIRLRYDHSTTFVTTEGTKFRSGVWGSERCEPQMHFWPSRLVEACPVTTDFVLSCCWCFAAAVGPSPIDRPDGRRCAVGSATDPIVVVVVSSCSSSTPWERRKWSRLPLVSPAARARARPENRDGFTERNYPEDKAKTAFGDVTESGKGTEERQEGGDDAV